MAMHKESKIYVAGHTGLLGSAVLDKLLSAGYMNVITRTHAELDLTRKTLVDRFFEEEHPEYIFLCAGLTGGIMANTTYPADFLYTNIAIQNNVFGAAHRYNVKHVVFYGSSCIYPKFSPQPIKEEYLFTGLIENTSEAYAVAKIAGITACKVFNRQYKTNCYIALVPNSIYGPRDNFDANNSHVVSALLGKFHKAKSERSKEIMLWGSGNPRREFLFCEDVADASIYAILHSDELENIHYNVGSGVDYSIKELAEVIKEVVGYTGSISWNGTMPDGTPKKLLDSSRFNKLGWYPVTPLKMGLELTYSWYLQSDNISK